MKNNKTEGVYKTIYTLSKMPFETDSIQQQKDGSSEWINLLKAVVKIYKTNEKKLKNKLQVETSGHYLIKPFIMVACKTMKNTRNSHYLELNETSIATLESQLEKSLIKIVENIIFSLKTAQNDDKRTALLNYVRQVYRQPIEFFEKFPVLARLLSMAAIYWINNTQNVLDRFVGDFPEISQRFDIDDLSVSNSSVIKTIKKLEVGLSDPHEYGTTVWIITCSNKKIVYKPKNVDAEIYLNKFIGWVNTVNKTEERLNTLKVISKNAYGWVEYADNQEQCKSNSDIALYYRHLGSLSAILYILRGTDHHHDNLISSGKRPYFIDHEMLCYPIYKDKYPEIRKTNSNEELQDNIYESVLNTLIYPINQKRVNGTVKDISAVGYYEEGEKNLHLPKLDNKYIHYNLYSDSIEDGFKQTYKKISDNKQYLLDSPESPLLKFKDVHIRFNVRATSSYLSIIALCITPGALINGKAFCDYIDSIRKKFPTIFQHGLPVDMGLDELKILSRLDVPRFTLKADNIALDGFSENQYSAIFDVSGYELVKSRIKSLSESDLNKQISYIVDSLSENKT